MYQGVMDLIGFGVQGSVARVATLSFITSTTSLLSTIVAPATINPGDLLILFDDTEDTSVLPTKVVPTGFTEIISSTDSLRTRSVFSYKIAVGNEDSTTITGMASTYPDKVMLQFRGDIAVTGVSTQDAAAELTDGDPATQTCNASTGITPLIVFGGYRSGNNISAVTRTFTPAADAEVNSGVYQYFKYKIYNSAPVDITVDIVDAGVKNGLTSFFLQVS